MPRAAPGSLQLSAAFAREHIVKRSRFAAVASPVRTVAAAQAFVRAATGPDASHNCWAFRLSAAEARAADDGEPAGTAGRPILAAIDAAGVAPVVVVVTRYFGGVKLGAAGLGRAYFAAAAKCIADAPKVWVVPMVTIHVTVAWEWVGKVHALVDSMERLDSIYNEDGCTVIVRVPIEDAARVETSLTNVCSGNVTIQRVDDDNIDNNDDA